jgi:2-polyprenyl-3-methyl-5-hydroxy-6-metoxy-1,4-benzoquinol methylase
MPNVKSQNTTKLYGRGGAFSGNEKFIKKVHEKRLKAGFADNREITETIIKQSVLKVLGKPHNALQEPTRKDEEEVCKSKRLKHAFFRDVLSDTLELTGSGRMRLDLIDMLAISNLWGHGKVKFLDVGCGIYEGSSPSAEETAKNFSQVKIPIEAVAIDKNVPPSLDGKTVNGVKYLKVNVLNKEELEKLGKFDYIRCMHLLYYFNSAVAEKIIGTLKGMLLPGGVLVEDSKSTKKKMFLRLHQKYEDGSVYSMDEGDPADLK